MLKEDLTKTTLSLSKERFNLLDATVKYYEVREQLKLREAEIMKELIGEVNGNGKPTYSNAESRQAELTIRQACDKTHQGLVEQRNNHWHAQKTEEIIIERLQNELLNLRTVLAVL